MVVRVCIDAQHSPFVTSLAFPQGIAPGENIELYIGTWDLPESPPPKANTIVVDPLTKVVHVARKLDAAGKRKAGGDPPGTEGARKKLLAAPKGGHRAGMNSSAGHANKPGAGNSTNSLGSGRNKCGECGQVFDSIKEISMHMQRHLAEKVPQEKSSVVTLTHRPKDGSAPSRATITQDPNCRNRVEVSIPLTAAESFLQTVLDQAQQILLKHIRPPAGGTLEVRKTDSYKEGDTNRSVILEALEQVNNAEPPVVREPTPPQRTQPGAPQSSRELDTSSSSSYPSASAASAAPAAAAAATATAERSRSQEIDDVERALEAIHAGADELSPNDLVAHGSSRSELHVNQGAGPSFDPQEPAKVMLAPQIQPPAASLGVVQVASPPVMADAPAPPAEQMAAGDNGNHIHAIQHQAVIPVEEVPLVLDAEPEQQNDAIGENQIDPHEAPAIRNDVQYEVAPVLDQAIPEYPAPIMPAEEQLPVEQPRGIVLEEIQEAAPLEPAPPDDNGQPHEIEPVQPVELLPREVEPVPAPVQLLPNLEPPRPSLRPLGLLGQPNMLLPRHHSRARDDGMQDEIGSSSEAVAATPHRLSRALMDPREPTSSADVDSTVGESEGGQASPDDGGVDSTSASSSSHGRGNGLAGCQRMLGSAEAAVEQVEAGQAERRHEVNVALNEAAARVAERFHQGHAANNQAALDLMGEYGLPDEMQEPHSGMQ